MQKFYAFTKGVLKNERARAVLSSQGEPVMLPSVQFSQRIVKAVADGCQIIQREALSLD